MLHSLADGVTVEEVPEVFVARTGWGHLGTVVVWFPMAPRVGAHREPARLAPFGLVQPSSLLEGRDVRTTGNAVRRREPAVRLPQLGLGRSNNLKHGLSLAVPSDRNGYKGQTARHNGSAAAENAALAQQLFGPGGSRPFSATTARRA